MANILSCGLVLAALALAASPAAAQGGGRPWCFYESGNRGSGAVTCTFYSFEQCMATASGIGGSCARNPYPSSGASYPADASTVKRKQRGY
jgi:hypothetical protein